MFAGHRFSAVGTVGGGFSQAGRSHHGSLGLTRIRPTLSAARPQALGSAAWPLLPLLDLGQVRLASRQSPGALPGTFPGALYLWRLRPLATPTWDGCGLAGIPATS